MPTLRRKVANSALAGVVALGCTNAAGITGLIKTPPPSTVAYASEIVADTGSGSSDSGDTQADETVEASKGWTLIGTCEWQVDGDCIVFDNSHSERHRQ